MDKAPPPDYSYSEYMDEAPPLNYAYYEYMIWMKLGFRAVNFYSWLPAPKAQNIVDL